MSSILLLRGKSLRSKQLESHTSSTASLSRARQRKSSVLSPTFFKSNSVIGWDLRYGGRKVTVALDLSTFTVLLDGIPVRDPQYHFLIPQCQGKRSHLRISFAAAFEPHTHPRVIELKATLDSDFGLGPDILPSEATTPLKLVNLTSLGLSFDHWLLSISTLM